jgi:formylglycine-generating enzyme required for sulfatase activity
MGKLPRQKIEEEALPVVNVTRKEAQEFIAKLNELDKEANFRLPTNTQWEYAARAGTKGSYSFNGSNDDLYRYGNCKSHGDRDDGYDGLAKVGSFKPNSWGLHDMYGNVAEWVDDSVISLVPTLAGLATVPEPRYITRGGSFENSATNCNSVFQSLKKRDQQSASIGFRIIRDVKLPR